MPGLGTVAYGLKRLSGSRQYFAHERNQWMRQALLELLMEHEDFMYVSAWEFKGVEKEPALHKESLNYEYIEVKTRNYKEAKS